MIATSQCFPRAISTAVFALLVALMPAEADLLSQDDFRFGPGSLTHDTRTGLTWLDVTLTVAMSYEQVLAATLPDGEFAGCRYATSEEVLSLYVSGGIPGFGVYPEASSVSQSFLSLIALVGATTSQYERPLTLGISGTDAGPARQGQIVPGLVFYLESGVPVYAATGLPANTLAYGVTTADASVGSWLVYQVPEPASCGLIIAGIAMILGRHRPRQLPGRVK
jgi:hypothetical protein